MNYAFNFLFAERIGKWIGRIGERKALTLEYVGLIGVFVSYGLVEDSRVAAALYIIDHMFFAMAIAMKTYFQKIADPKDMAASAGVFYDQSYRRCYHSCASWYRLGCGLVLWFSLLEQGLPCAH